MKGWTLDDIPWQRFAPSKVEADLLASLKAAALVEHNSRDYETYLHNVFADDPAFLAAVSEWADEEVRHGEALARWAELADPGFDFEACFRRFHDGYRLPLAATRSVRGSRAGELIARCVVESGTSSFYSAIKAAVEAPVLKEFCPLIAADEFRHYKLFYLTLNRYLRARRLSRWRRVWVAFVRMLEIEDDELAFAYHCANDMDGPYRRRACSRAYARRAYPVYRFRHLDRGVAMALKAAGVKPQGWLGKRLSALAWRFVRWRGGRRAGFSRAGSAA
jgi:rubrerythrin